MRALDVLADAVVGDSNPLGKATEAQFNNIFDTNVKGRAEHRPTTIAILPEDGSVVITGSTASIKGGVGMSLYGGAKAARRSMVRAWIQVG
ncbi:SDR family NAD(P)-dependent oxidoreductase [Streptomyces sp. 3N207]|uniref:SDR family NAD(P)-dependent oxidoreductase n=1 Tax=Streptomyces sp. 3N207 TaxID=3457417 RepID=UPI003FD5AE55